MKYYGAIGFAKTVEYKPGRFRDEIQEHNYYGDVLRNSYRNQNADKIVDDVVVSNQISILSDDYALQNIARAVYVTWMGSKWKISSVDVEFPRLVLTIGSPYPESETED